jgi:uncharacterized membrane protein HdeD (DUF308 family)
MPAIMKQRHWPISFLILAVLGALCLVAGVAALAGLFQNSHPLLRDDMAGWGLIVSAIALLLSGAFPLVLRRLQEHDTQAQAGK